MLIPLLSNTKEINGEIKLPPSKSISNRALFLAALSGTPIVLENLSQCDDTLAFMRAINSDKGLIDIGAAGTAMRFATALLSQRSGQYILTGSERMKQRPIGILVDALRQLGAKITYTENEGFPPLNITGTILKGESITIDASISSQYISALMMLASSLPNGLTINIIGNWISKAYIEMTRTIMMQFGIPVTISENQIIISNAQSTIKRYAIESDWSAASYWYELLAIKGVGKIYLIGLFKNSCQGDAKIGELFKHFFGIETEFVEDGIIITHSSIAVNQKMIYDFTNEPDMAQTFAVCCCLINKHFYFSGLQSLKIKETDRITALINELAKLGFRLTTPTENELCWNGEKNDINTHISIETYHDHRMAMAFAPVALRYAINIENPEVISKSYPTFWNDFKTTLSF
ncbi:MAG: 3-phosphoshikimate 1-carboxyvinyltransferase [Paludibacteraceae bacterium]|jgi:3-phosphoshikimate 1-carboxyvinyltransferase|nr:3-phosphoshikimate 1-carboxyvinyltransferase [Paludibacteraceae bacterium]